MKLFDFWAFQNFMEMLSHDKIIFHMLFGAFQITSRITNNSIKNWSQLNIKQFHMQSVHTKVLVRQLQRFRFQHSRLQFQLG